VHSPGPPPVKRAPFKTHHARSSSLGAFAGYDFNPTAPPPWQSYTPAAPARTKVEEENDLTDSPRESMETSERPKPQLAPTEDRFSEDASGFISPMAQYTPSVSPTPGSNRSMQPQNPSHRRMTTAEELADLGIGNSKSKKPAFDALDEELEAEEGGAPPRVRDENAQNSSDPAAGGSSSKTDDKPSEFPRSISICRRQISMLTNYSVEQRSNLRKVGSEAGSSARLVQQLKSDLDPSKRISATRRPSTTTRN